MKPFTRSFAFLSTVKRLFIFHLVISFSLALVHGSSALPSSSFDIVYVHTYIHTHTRVYLFSITRVNEQAYVIRDRICEKGDKLQKNDLEK